jgi:hypothetical protein
VSAPATAQTRRTHPGAGLALLMIVGGGFLTQLLSTVTGVVSARMLGVEGRGQIVLVAALAALTSQLTLGGSLPNAITRQLAERGVTARDGLRHMVRRWTLWALLFAAVAGGYFLFLQRHHSGEAKYGLALGVVITAIQTIMSRIMVGAMLGEGADLIHVAMTGVLPQGLTTIVICTAFGLGARWNAVEITAVTRDYGCCTNQPAAARTNSTGPNWSRSRAGRTSAASARSTGWPSTAPWSARCSAAPSWACIRPRSHWPDSPASSAGAWRW